MEKSKSAANLKHAIIAGVEASRATLRDEFEERKALAGESKFHLNENSSALLSVPKEITRSITKARTLERWNAAKEAEKQYLEETMTNRINQFAAEKAQRLSKAAENVTRVAHTPIDRQATTPYDYELAANEASQLELGSVISSITQAGVGNVDFAPKSAGENAEESIQSVNMDERHVSLANDKGRWWGLVLLILNRVVRSSTLSLTICKGASMIP